MSLTLNYDQDNARVEIVVDGLQTAGAALYTIERSTDQVNWTRVRGAINQEVVDDNPVVYFDYEFTVGAVNHYRVMSIALPTYVGVGAVDANSGNTTGRTVTPPLPANVQEGDVLVIWLGMFNHPSLGTAQATVPTGWSAVLNDQISPGAMANYIFVKTAGPSETAPDISIGFSGGETAQMAAWRGTSLPPSYFATDRERSGTTSQIQFPELVIAEPYSVAVAFGISEDLWTSVSASAGFTLIDDDDSVVPICWQYQLLGNTTDDIPTGFFNITGGTHDNTLGHGLVLPFGNPEETELFTDDIAPTLTVAWLKNPLRPTRNMAVKLGRPTNLRRAARSGLFDIKGRADPIEVTEIRRSIAWVQPFVADNFGESDGLLDLFEPGETLLLHVPGRDDSPECPPSQDLPGGYIHVGDVVEERSPDKSLPRAFTAPVQKVAGPRPELGFIEPPESSS